ncbi:MAG: hypothetical protein ACFB6S_04070 [Geminicoccaceae bacterium]
MSSVLSSLVALLAEPWLPWLIGLFIILLAIVVGVHLRYGVLIRLNRAIDNAAGLIGETDGAHAFSEQFATIDRQLAQDPWLGHWWRRYTQALIRRAQDDLLASPEPAVDSLSLDHLLTGHVNLRLYQALPGYFVGAGLIFTFLGLVAALYVASAGVSAPDIEDAQVALASLLSAATFKFVTSIAGLAASIGFSWAEKRAVHGTRVRLAWLAEQVDARVALVTLESLAAAQLDEMRRQRMPAFASSPAVLGGADGEIITDDDLRLAERFLAMMDQGASLALDAETRLQALAKQGSLEEGAHSRQEINAIALEFRRLTAELRGFLAELKLDDAAGGSPEGRRLAARLEAFNGAVRGFLRRADQRVAKGGRDGGSLRT